MTVVLHLFDTTQSVTTLNFCTINKRQIVSYRSSKIIHYHKNILYILKYVAFITLL